MNMEFPVPLPFAIQGRGVLRWLNCSCYRNISFVFKVSVLSFLTLTTLMWQSMKIGSQQNLTLKSNAFFMD